MISLPAPVILETPGVMTRAELISWAQVGKNAVPQLVSLFGLHELSGSTKGHRYSLHGVLRGILGVTPETADDLRALLVPLQKVSWVSKMTGLSDSAINARVTEKRGRFPFPIELTITESNQAAARGRRWIAAQVAAHLRGDPIPFLIQPAAHQTMPPTHVPAPARNVFREICANNAEVSRERQL
jgi:hypothetical protein